MNKNQIDDDVLIDLYCNKEWSISKISGEINCYAELLSKRLKYLNIPIRSGNHKGYYKNRTNNNTCDVCGEEGATQYYNSEKYYCLRHRNQMDEYGCILERTKFDKNEIIFKDDYCIMYLYNDKHEIVSECYFDKDDLEIVKHYKWHSDRQGYVVTRINGKRLSMHRLFMDEPKNKLTDHINQNKADNRRVNLRLVDKSKNEANKPPRIDNTSGVKGVSYRKDKGLWDSEIRKKEQRIRKLFDNFDSAVKHRITNESKLFGEHSYNYNHETNTIQLAYLSHDDSKQTYIEADMDGNVLRFEKLT